MSDRIVVPPPMGMPPTSVPISAPPPPPISVSISPPPPPTSVPNSPPPVSMGVSVSEEAVALPAFPPVRLIQKNARYYWVIGNDPLRGWDGTKWVCPI